LAIGCLGVAIAAETGGMLLLREFIDRIIVGDGDATSLIWIAGAFLLLAILRGAFSYVSGRSSAYASEKVIRSTRNRLFDHLQRLAFSYHDKVKTGELIQRATSDVDTVRRFYAEQARGFSRIGFLFSINFTAIAIINWKLALLSIIAVPLLVWTSIIFYKRIHNAYEAYQKQDGKLSAILQENLAGVRIVKAFNRQQFEEEKFEIENGEKLKRGMRLFFTEASFWPVAETIGGLQLAGGILAGGLMVVSGSISIGTFVAYVGMIKGIIWPLQEFGRLVAHVSTTAVSYGRLRTVLNEDREDTETGSRGDGNKLSGRIQFKELSFSYDKDTPVLKNVNLECTPGQRIALLGEPGSGKTSLVNLLPGFYTHKKGTLELDGRAVGEYSRRFLRENIGIVEQEPFLFSTDIRSNITYGTKRVVSQTEVEAAATTAAIHESITGFPQGYETMVGEKGVTLSGGQKQRIAIARTVLKDPAILILDDSTSAVDSETEELIRNALEKLMRGRTTFIIAHRVQSLMNADQILVFKEGEIIQRGTHAELIAADGFYSDVFELQTRIEMELKEQLSHG
jgi:ATP-binding cassette, subfamily B, bacterial